MTKANKLELGIVIGIMLFTIVAMITLIQGKTPTALGSVQDGQGYYSTTTHAFPATANTVKLIKTGSGTFGSVVITNSTAGVIDFYDATTTVNGALYGTTTLAKLGTSLAAGTYTFDVNFNTGLIAVSSTGNIASSTITYR